MVRRNCTYIISTYVQLNKIPHNTAVGELGNIRHLEVIILPESTIWSVRSVSFCAHVLKLYQTEFFIVYLMKIDPLLLIGSLTATVASIIVYIILKYSRKKEKALTGSSKDIAKALEVPTVKSPSADKEPDTYTIKKSISFNTVYNLEEFMVRLYKIGFLVRRLKSGGIEKERFISIDQKGSIRFHKVLQSKHNDQAPVRCHKPYFSFPISTLKECFACDENPPPSFIMEFQGKTLHLAVASTLDRDYIVKGLNLVMQRAKKNSNFLLRSSSLLDGPLSPDEHIRVETDEYEDDDVSQVSQTTMNTTSRSYYGKR